MQQREQSELLQLLALWLCALRRCWSLPLALPSLLLLSDAW